VVYLWVIHSYRLPIGAAAIVVGLCGVVLQRERLRIPAPLVWCGLWVAWAGIGYFTATHPEMTGPKIWEYVKLWLIFLLALNLCHTKQQLRLMIIAWLGIFAIYPVRGILFNFASGIQIQGRYQWNFIFSNPNDFATLTLPLMALSTATLQSAKEKWVKYCALAGTILLPLCIVITESRGGILALATFGTLVLFQYRRRIGAVLMILMVIGLIAQLAPQSVWNRVSGLKSVFNEETLDEADPYGSAKQRYDIWRVARAIAKDHPVFGIGAGAYPEVHLEYALTGRYPGFVVQRRDPHSTYLHAAAENGLPGLGLFLGVIISTFVAGIHGIKRIKKSDPKTAQSIQTLLFGLIAFLQASIFASMEFLPHVYIFIAIIITMVAVNLPPPAEPGIAANPRRRG
jgi:probable O-glycosylation ligase (exosortase A-associated)